MRSSTSSFRALPQGWLSLGFAVLVFVLGLIGMELFWRARGLSPSLSDDEQLWCRERQRARGNPVVLVGSSRLQTGIDPRVLSDALGGTPAVQLAVAGTNPIPALLELAQDREFTGTVLLEYMPRRFLTPDSRATAQTMGYLTACADPSLVSEPEALIRHKLQDHLVVLNPELDLIAVASYIARHRRLPDTSHAVVRRDRFHAILDPGNSGALDRWEAALSPDALAAQITRLRAAVSSIEARGGRVILIRSPVSGAVLAEEEKRFPAATWFPRVAAALATPSIDFSNIPELRDLRVSDGEHPVATDTAMITRAVARELVRLMK